MGIFYYNKEINYDRELSITKWFEIYVVIWSSEENKWYDEILKLIYYKEEFVIEITNFRLMKSLFYISVLKDDIHQYNLII